MKLAGFLGTVWAEGWPDKGERRMEGPLVKSTASVSFRRTNCLLRELLGQWNHPSPRPSPLSGEREKTWFFAVLPPMPLLGTTVRTACKSWDNRRGRWPQGATYKKTPGLPLKKNFVTVPHGPAAHPQVMKSIRDMLIWVCQWWSKVVTLWCCELAQQFDLDIATNPKLLPFPSEAPSRAAVLQKLFKTVLHGPLAHP